VKAQCKAHATNHATARRTSQLKSVPAGSTLTRTAHVLQEIHHIFINGPFGLHMSARLL
jgi:hypothetical protein